MMGWIIGLLAVIALLLMLTLCAVCFIGMMIEERLKGMHAAIWAGLHNGNLGPFLEDVILEMRRNT